METILRAPQMFDEKRVLPLGLHVLARTSSTAALAVAATQDAQAEVVVSENEVALMAQVTNLEADNKKLRLEISLANERLQNMKNDIENEYDRARDEGFAAGQKQGGERALADWREKLDRLSSIIDAASTSREQIAKANEDVIAEVVFAATLRIVGQQAARVESVRRVLTEVVADVGAASVVRLRVAKRDHALVESLLVEMSGGDARCQVIADDNVSLGGCIIEQERGSLDARLETQLEALRRAVLKPYAEVLHD